jgi:hypothetical protein
MPLPSDLLAIILDYVDADIICSFLAEHKDKLSLGNFASNPHGPISFVFAQQTALTETDRFKLAFNPSMDLSLLETLEKEPSLWDSTELSIAIGLYETAVPLAFWERNIDRLDWRFLCLFADLPVSFWKKHYDDLHWPYLCGNEHIPFSFFEDHVDKLDFDCLAQNRSVPLVFLEKHKHKISTPGWGNMGINPNIPATLLLERPHELGWNQISRNPCASLEFWDMPQYREELTFSLLVQSFSVTNAMLAEIRSKMRKAFPWQELSTNTCEVAISFLLAHADHIHWESFSCNKAVQPEFLMAHLNQVSWKTLPLHPTFWVYHARKELLPILRSL